MQTNARAVLQREPLNCSRSLVQCSRGEGSAKVPRCCSWPSAATREPEAVPLHPLRFFGSVQVQLSTIVSANGKIMHSTDAIAAFFKKGGRVVKLQESIPVRAPEVLEYLQASGVSANFSPRHSRRYLCNGKLVPLTTLVEVANSHRRAQQLPPFVAHAKV